MQERWTLGEITFGNGIDGLSRRCPLALVERVYHERELALGVEAVDRKARRANPSERLLRSVFIGNYAQGRGERRGRFELAKRGKRPPCIGHCRNECLRQRRLWCRAFFFRLSE